MASAAADRWTMDKKALDAGHKALIAALILLFIVTYNIISNKNEQIASNRTSIVGLRYEANQGEKLQSAVEAFVNKVCNNAIAQDPTTIGGDQFGNPVQEPNRRCPARRRTSGGLLTHHATSLPPLTTSS